MVAYERWWHMEARLYSNAKSDVQTDNRRACVISRQLVLIRFILSHLQNYLFWYTTVQTLVQSPRSEKSRVYQIWTTRGSQYIDSIQSLNSIQLGQKLIDNSVCYPCAVMPTARCKRIKLVKEENTRLCTLGSVFNLK